MFRTLGKIIRERFQKNRKDTTVTQFFNKVEEYKESLNRSYANVLGKELADRVSESHQRLLGPDSYMFKDKSLRSFTAGGFSPEDNLVFYVAAEVPENNVSHIDSDGNIAEHTILIKTSPCFFLAPDIIKKHSQELENKSSLHPYVFLWIHEYSHFIVYCLQNRPISVAMSILYGELRRLGHQGLSIYNIKELIERKGDEISTRISETILWLHSLDEDIAGFLQELILADMDFPMESSLAQNKNVGVFFPVFKKWGKESFVNYLIDWNIADYKIPSFMNTFLKSINKVNVERYPINDLQKSAV